MRYNCPDCGAIASVSWFVAFPSIWKCEVCGTLHAPQEVVGLSLRKTHRHRDLSDNRGAIASSPVVTNAPHL